MNVRRIEESLRIKFFRALYKNKMKVLRILQEQQRNEERIRWMNQRFAEARLKRQNQNLGGQNMYRKPGQPLNEFHQMNRSFIEYSSQDHQKSGKSRKRKRRSNNKNNENRHHCSKKSKQSHTTK